MNRDEANTLLEKLRKLGKSNVVIDTFLRQAEIDIKMEISPRIPSQEYIDGVLIDKHLLKLVDTIITFQAHMIRNIENEIVVQNAMNKQ